MMDSDQTPGVLMSDIAEKLQQARAAHKWSQIELASRAGVSRPTVARIERGDDVSTATLVKVALALDLKLELT